MIVETNKLNINKRMEVNVINFLDKIEYISWLKKVYMLLRKKETSPLHKKTKKKKKRSNKGSIVLFLFEG